MITKVLETAHSISIVTNADGQKGNKKSLFSNGIETNDRRNSGACSEETTSTTWHRKTKSGSLAFTPANFSVQRNYIGYHKNY